MSLRSQTKATALSWQWQIETFFFSFLTFLGRSVEEKQTSKYFIIEVLDLYLEDLKHSKSDGI